MADVFFAPGRLLARVEVGVGVRARGSPTAQRPEGLDADPARRILVRLSGVRLLSVRRGGGRGSHHGRVSGRASRARRLLGHPFAGADGAGCRRDRMMGCAEAGWATVGRGQSDGDHADALAGRTPGVMTCTASRPTVVAGGLMPRLRPVGTGGGRGRGDRAARRRRTRPVCGRRPQCRCSSRACRPLVP